MAVPAGAQLTWARGQHSPGRPPFWDQARAGSLGILVLKPESTGGSQSRREGTAVRA